MKLSKLKAPRPTKTTVEYVDGDTLPIVYDRSHFDTHFATLKTWRAQLAYLLISWEVDDDENEQPGRKVYAPRDDANGSRPAEWMVLFEPLPDAALRPILDQILDEFYAGPKVAAASTAT